MPERTEQVDAILVDQRRRARAVAVVQTSGSRIANGPETHAIAGVQTGEHVELVKRVAIGYHDAGRRCTDAAEPQLRQAVFPLHGRWFRE